MPSESNKYDRAIDKVEFGNSNNLSRKERLALTWLTKDKEKLSTNTKDNLDKNKSDVLSALSKSEEFLLDKWFLTKTNKWAIIINKAKKSQRWAMLDSITNEVVEYVTRRWFLISKNKRNQREESVVSWYTKLVNYWSSKDPLTSAEIQSMITIIDKQGSNDDLDAISQSKIKLLQEMLQSKFKSISKPNQAPIITPVENKPEPAPIVSTPNNIPTVQPKVEPVSEVIIQDQDQSPETVVQTITKYVNVRSRLNTRTVQGDQVWWASSTKLTKWDKVQINNDLHLSKMINGKSYDFVQITMINDKEVAPLWVASKYLSDTAIVSPSTTQTPAVASTTPSTTVANSQNSDTAPASTVTEAPVPATSNTASEEDNTETEAQKQAREDAEQARQTELREQARLREVDRLSSKRKLDLQEMKFQALNVNPKMSSRLLTNEIYDSWLRHGVVLGFWEGWLSGNYKISVTNNPHTNKYCIWFSNGDNRVWKKIGFSFAPVEFKSISGVMVLAKKLHSMLLKPQNNYKFEQDGNKVITKKDGIWRDNDSTTLFKLLSNDSSSSLALTNWLNWLKDKNWKNIRD